MKTLNCPFKMSCYNLEAINSTMRKFTIYKHLIIDLERISIYDILKIVRNNPERFLKIDLN